MGMPSVRIWFAVLLIVTKTAKSQHTKPYKLYDVNMRVGGTTESKRVRSLLECSTLFERSESSLSFNYNPVEKVCEPSSNYPEDQAEAGEGWKVYAPIVDGAWTDWSNWGSCTVESTRSRSRTCGNLPSNGGKACTGDLLESGPCSNQGTYVGNYFISSYMVIWDEANATCEAILGRLVVINDQAEQDILTQAITGAMNHWIGMTCNSGTSCVWVDGTNVGDNGYLNWGPGQPDHGDCTWIGLSGPYWDESSCVIYQRFFICEF